MQIFGAQKLVFGAQKPVLGAQNLVFELPNPRDGLSFLAGAFFSPQNFDFLAENPILGSKKAKKKVEIEGAGPPQRDPQRNSASGGGHQVKNGGTATHLVTNLGDLGSAGVPAPARTPLGT